MPAQNLKLDEKFHHSLQRTLGPPTSAQISNPFLAHHIIYLLFVIQKILPFVHLSYWTRSFFQVRYYQTSNDYANIGSTRFLKNPSHIGSPSYRMKMIQTLARVYDPECSAIRILTDLITTNVHIQTIRSMAYASLLSGINGCGIELNQRHPKNSAGPVIAASRDQGAPECAQKPPPLPPESSG